MSEVPATATPLSRDATAAAFLPAYAQAFGALPDRNRAELLLALVWLENANGKAIIQHNWGNLATKPNGGDYWRPPWFDLAAVEALPDGGKKSRLLDLHQRMLNGAAPEAFRAFASHELGAAAWLRLLQKPGMSGVLAAASSGDAVAFAHAIFSSGYCPDPECRDAGPSYDKLRDEIRARNYFGNLDQVAPPVVQVPKKKVHPEPGQGLGLWFWCWGRLLSARTSFTAAAGAGVSLRMGEL